MTSAPSLLQILFYLVSLLAPADTAKITLTANPSDVTRFTKTASGSWMVEKDGQQWKADGDFLVVHSKKGDTKGARLRMLPFEGNAPTTVKSLTTHDWKKEKTLSLFRGLTMEKSDDGFIFHIQRGPDAPVEDLRAVLSK